MPVGILHKTRKQATLKHGSHTGTTNKGRHLCQAGKLSRGNYYEVSKLLGEVPLPSLFPPIIPRIGSEGMIGTPVVI